MTACSSPQTIQWSKLLPNSAVHTLQLRLIQQPMDDTYQVTDVLPDIRTANDVHKYNKTQTPLVALCPNGAFVVLHGAELINTARDKALDTLRCRVFSLEDIQLIPLLCTILRMHIVQTDVPTASATPPPITPQPTTPQPCLTEEQATFLRSRNPALYMRVKMGDVSIADALRMLPVRNLEQTTPGVAKRQQMLPQQSQQPARPATPQRLKRTHRSHPGLHPSNAADARYYADLAANVPAAVELEQVLKNVQLHIPDGVRYTPDRQRIHCTAKLRQLIQRDADALQLALRVIVAAWPHDHTLRQRRIVHAMWLVMHGNKREFMQDTQLTRFIAAMKCIAAPTLLKLAANKNKKAPEHATEDMAAYFRNHYSMHSGSANSSANTVAANA